MSYITTTILDDPLLVRRTEDFRGGMDNFNRATRLPDAQVQLLHDYIIRDNGRIQLRAGADALGGAAIGGFTTKAIQGLCYFDVPSYEQLLAMLNGLLYYWDGATWTAIAMAGWAPTDTSKPEMAVGINKVFITDGINNWRSWDGAVLADLGNVVGIAGDPPVGAMINCWHGQAMFASGKGSEPDAIWRSAVLDAGQGKWDHENFKFRAGGGEGDDVVGLASLKSFMLGVAKRNSILIYQTDPAATSATAFQQIYRGGSIGCVGKRAHVVHGDFWYFLSQDGIRRLGPVVGDRQQFEIGPPLSEALQPWVDRINWQYAGNACASAYRHLVFFAVPLDAATQPSHLLVWNARLGAWSGVWRSWTPTIFANTQFSDQLRLAIGDTAGRVNQWKDQDATGLVASFKDNSAEIASLARSRSWDFDEPESPKTGDHATAYFVESSGMATLRVVYDGQTALEQAIDLAQISNQLPVNLPFNLAIIKPKIVTVALDELGQFREAYVEIETAKQKIVIQKIELAAYLDALESEQAA